MTMRPVVAGAEVPVSRVARRRDQKVQNILTAAADVLAERGFHGMNLDEIADRLDLTKATLYHYFPSKEALVNACLEVLATRINERLAEVAADSAGTASERLSRLIRTQLVIIVRDHPQMARMFLQPMDWHCAASTTWCSAPSCARASPLASSTSRSRSRCTTCTAR